MAARDPRLSDKTWRDALRGFGVHKPPDQEQGKEKSGCTLSAIPGRQGN